MRNNKRRSFTLIEVIVVVALVGIVGAAIVSMIVPASNFFARIADEVETKMKASQIMQTIVPQVRYAGELVIGSDYGQIGSETDQRYLYNQDGKMYIYMDGETSDLFSDDFYEGCVVELAAEKLENNLVQLTLAVSLAGGESKSELETAVRVLNTQEVGGTEGTVLAYTWNEVPAGT
jgi:prepilin-type N-terminal cleavage/methylation domain-containing protein